MKIVSKTLMVNFSESVKLGNNNAIELDIESIAFISPGEYGEVNINFDLGIDITNIKFLGNPIENTFDGFRQFKESLLPLGIDLAKLIDEKLNSMDEEEIKDIFTAKFGNVFSK